MAILDGFPTFDFHHYCDNLLDTAEQLRDDYQQVEKVMREMEEAFVYMDRTGKFQNIIAVFRNDKDKIYPICDKFEEYESEVFRPLAKIVQEYESVHDYQSVENSPKEYVKSVCPETVDKEMKTEQGVVSREQQSKFDSFISKIKKFLGVNR